MNIVLMIMQVLIAIHTLIGAVWKFSTTAQETMPSLGSIPSGVWMGLAVLEILAAIGFVLPIFKKRLASTVFASAGFLILEMLGFTVIHSMAGSPDSGPIVYWLIVAGIAALIIVGRLKFKMGTTK